MLIIVLLKYSTYCSTQILNPHDIIGPQFVCLKKSLLVILATISIELVIM